MMARTSDSLSGDVVVGTPPEVVGTGSRAGRSWATTRPSVALSARNARDAAWTLMVDGSFMACRSRPCRCQDAGLAPLLERGSSDVERGGTAAMWGGKKEL